MSLDSNHGMIQKLYIIAGMSVVPSSNNKNESVTVSFNTSNQYPTHQLHMIENTTLLFNTLVSALENYWHGSDIGLQC